MLKTLRLMDELVSIITPSYNCERFIADTIKAIQAQTYPKWELIITDDCSCDKSISIIQDFVQKDKRIRLLKLQKNSGAGVARNNSIKEAKGRYIAFCDSDDRWLPTKLEKQLSLMKENGCAAVYSSYFTCTNDGRINGMVKCRKSEDDFSIKCDDKMGNLTFMYDESVTGKIFMPEIRKRQDWAHKMAVMNIVKKACGVQEPLAIYRHSDTSISKEKIGLVKYNIAAYQTLGWSKGKAVLWFIFLFLPNYFLKKFLQKVYNKDYKRYLHLVE